MNMLCKHEHPAEHMKRDIKSGGMVPTEAATIRWIVMLNGQERDRVCDGHRSIYMVAKTRRTLRPMPGVRFVRIVDDDRPVKRAGFMPMDVETMHKVTAAMAKQGKPISFERRMTASGATFTSKGMTKRAVKDLLG